MRPPSDKLLKYCNSGNDYDVNEKVLCIFETNNYCPPVLFIHFTGETK